MNKVWEAEARLKVNGFPGAKTEELAGILWLSEKTSLNQTPGGNQVRLVTWSQIQDDLGVRWRNSHLNWWEIKGHWKFLSGGNGRIYFINSPQVRWKGLGGTALWNAEEIYLKERPIGLGNWLEMENERGKPLLDWIKEDRWCLSLDQLAAFFVYVLDSLNFACTIKPSRDLVKILIDSVFLGWNSSFLTSSLVRQILLVHGSTALREARF